MDLLKLFTPEAVATYLVFFFGVFVAIVGFFIRRAINKAKPMTVKLIKVSETSLVRINDEFRRDISISFKQEPIASIYLTDFQISNNSERVLEDVEIIINFQRTKVLDLKKNDPLPKRGSEIVWHDNIWSEDNGSSISLKFPYLNQEKIYQDIVGFSVITQDPIRVNNIIGGGREWKVEFIDRVKLSEEISKSILSSIPSTGTDLDLIVSVGKSIIKNVPKFIKLRGF